MNAFHVRQVDCDVGIVREVGIGVVAALGLHGGVVLEGTLDNPRDLLGGVWSDDSPRLCIRVIDVEARDPVELVVYGTVAGIGDAVFFGLADIIEDWD